MESALTTVKMSGQNGPEKVKCPSFFIENILTEGSHKADKPCKNEEKKEEIDNESTQSQVLNLHSENSPATACRDDGYEDNHNDTVSSPETPRDKINRWCGSFISMDPAKDNNELSDDGITFANDDILNKFRPKKKTRTVFSRHQIFYLESAFDTKKYLSSSERADIAATLNLTETQVKVWFQNRRNKWKSQASADNKNPTNQESPYMLSFPGSSRLMHFGQFPPSFSGFPLYRHRFLYF